MPEGRGIGRKIVRLKMLYQYTDKLAKRGHRVTSMDFSNTAIATPENPPIEKI
jgi:hypothetical protein